VSTEASSSQAKVHLPAGVSIGPGRETSQLNAQGQVVQGLVFPLTLPNGTTTSVFIANAELHDTAKAQQTIDARVNAILAITG
jgi:hypothetical protein